MTVNTVLFNWDAEHLAGRGTVDIFSKETLLDYLLGYMPNPDKLSDDERRVQYDGYLSQLKHWR